MAIYPTKSETKGLAKKNILKEGQRGWDTGNTSGQLKGTIKRMIF